MEIAINGRFLAQEITGVQRYARELVQAIDSILERRPGLKVIVMAPRFSGPAPQWRHVVLQQGGNLQGHAWEQLELPWMSGGLPLFCPGNTAPLISLFGQQRVTVTVHDLSYRYFPSAYKRAFRFWYGMVIPVVLRRSAAVITVSESERAAIASLYPAASSRLHAIQNGGLPSGFGHSAKSGPETDRRYVLYVGSLSKRKNFQGALETARRLARKRCYNFVFVGSNAGGILNSALDIPNDILSHFTFTGQIDNTADLLKIYREAACLLFPSHYESSGLPPIEAMACGCPVIVSDIPALRERCGNAAIYCDPSDVDSIAAAVEQVMDNPSLQSRLQAFGYERAAMYTWEQCALRTLEVVCGDHKM